MYHFGKFSLHSEVNAVGKYSKLRRKILSGSSDSNVEFSALCQLLAQLGFEERVKGSHHIFTCDGIEEI